MSDDKKPDLKTKEGLLDPKHTGYDIIYDNDVQRNIMILRIPLGTIAEVEDIQAQMMLRGFFDMMKEEALATVRVKKMKAQADKANRSGILVPGQVPMPPGPKFKVH